MSPFRPWLDPANVWQKLLIISRIIWSGKNLPRRSEQEQEAEPACLRWLTYRFRDWRNVHAEVSFKDSWRSARVNTLWLLDKVLGDMTTTIYLNQIVSTRPYRWYHSVRIFVDVGHMILGVFSHLLAPIRFNLLFDSQERFPLWKSSLIYCSHLSLQSCLFEMTSRCNWLVNYFSIHRPPQIWLP